MHHPFVPLLLLILAPLAYLAHRLGRLSHPAVRWVLAACALAILAASVWAGGVDFIFLNRMKLLVAGAAVLLVWLGNRGAAGLADRRRYRFLLTGLAVIGWLVHLNFLSFHGARTYIHLHDVAHYYLGSKYFPEVDYGELYTAMLRAEAEKYDDHFRAIEARDLETQGLVHIRALLQRSDPIKARFAPERWRAFQEDVAFFREAMGPQYAEVLQDHGFNPTPVWGWVGGVLANLVPAGSHRGILLLTLLDPLLLAGMFAAVLWAFDVEAMLLSMLYFCVLFGASFGYTGGAFLRYMWLFGVVAAVCCVQRQRHALAGGLLAWAAMMSVFPALFIVPLVGKAAFDLAARRRVPRHLVKLFLTFSATAVVLFAGTLLSPPGLERWKDFSTNMQHHLGSGAYNAVGLNEILSYAGPAKPSSPPEFARERERRSAITLVQLLVVFPLMLWFVAWRSRKEDDAAAVAMAVLLIFTALTLASYYYALLLVLVITRARDPISISLMFAAEAVMYTLQLFEEREVVLYFYHNILLASVLAGLYLEPLKIGLSRRSPGT